MPEHSSASTEWPQQQTQPQESDVGLVKPGGSFC